MMKHKLIYTIIILLLALSACSKSDDYVYPSVLLDFMKATADSTGAVTTLTSDKGLVYHVVANISGVTFAKDTSQRIVTYYQIYKKATADSIGSVGVYSLLKIICSTPRIGNYVWSKDPVTVQSIWRSGDYINLALGIKMQNGSHLMAFLQSGDTVINNKHVITVKVSHNKNGDYEAYTKVTYLSIPLSSYETLYPSGFTLKVLIPTSDGDAAYSFDI